jgi:hypothetical protein
VIFCDETVRSKQSIHITSMSLREAKIDYFHNCNDLFYNRLLSSGILALVYTCLWKAMKREVYKENPLSSHELKKTINSFNNVS